MAHGRKENHDARFVRPYFGRFCGHFSHPNTVLIRIKTIKDRGMTIQLITEDEN